LVAPVTTATLPSRLMSAIYRRRGGRRAEKSAV
jgi:hypothetical protein